QQHSTPGVYLGTERSLKAVTSNRTWEEVMRFAKGTAAALAVMIGLCAQASAAEPASEQDQTTDIEQKSDKPRLGRLILPFSALENLSDEQVQQLKEIHGRYLDQIKALQVR